jgi:hypothetical protein
LAALYKKTALHQKVPISQSCLKPRKFCSLEELAELYAESDALFARHTWSGIFIFQIMRYPVSVLFKIDFPDIAFIIPGYLQVQIALSNFRINFVDFIAKLGFIIHGNPPFEEAFFHLVAVGLLVHWYESRTHNSGFCRLSLLNIKIVALSEYSISKRLTAKQNAPHLVCQKAGRDVCEMLFTAGWPRYRRFGGFQ